MSHYPVRFDVHMTCGIGEMIVFIFHETSYDHMMKEPCDFVRGDPSS